MKTFLEAIIQPQGQLQDRSLEGFRNILDQLMLETQNIVDPQAKQEIGRLVNQFFHQMKTSLTKYKGQNVGYTAYYHPDNLNGGNF